MSMSIPHLQVVKDIAETRERDERCSSAREMPGQGTFRKHDVGRLSRRALSGRFRNVVTFSVAILLRTDCEHHPPSET